MKTLRKKKKRLRKPEPKECCSEEAATLLPAPISGIQPQKKNNFRFSVFVENQFLIGVSDSTLIKCNLSKGVVMTPFLLKEIRELEDRWAIREYFLRLLGRRDHARNELRDKALKKNFPSGHIEKILDELEEKKYINNAVFARKFARDKFEFNRWGITKIRAHLLKKGVPKADIQRALSEIGKENRDASMVELVRKNSRKFQREEDLIKRKKKIFDFLLRKGYESDNILQQIGHLMDITK